LLNIVFTDDERVVITKLIILGLALAPAALTPRVALEALTLRVQPSK
jgi:hypothetical protein